MKFFDFFNQVRSAHVVGKALEEGRTPSKAHLKNLGIDEILAKSLKR